MPCLPQYLISAIFEGDRQEEVYSMQYFDWCKGRANTIVMADFEIRTNVIKFVTNGIER